MYKKHNRYYADWTDRRRFDPRRVKMVFTLRSDREARDAANTQASNRIDDQRARGRT